MHINLPARKLHIMPSLLDDHHILAFIAEKERETPQCGLKLFCSPESENS